MGQLILKVTCDTCNTSFSFGAHDKRHHTEDFTLLATYSDGSAKFKCKTCGTTVFGDFITLEPSDTNVCNK